MVTYKLTDAGYQIQDPLNLIPLGSVKDQVYADLRDFRDEVKRVCGFVPQLIQA